MDTPPLFKQGASARVRAGFFALIAIVMLFVDSHLHSLTTMRQVVGTMLYPLQMATLLPRDAIYKASDYFQSLSRLQQDNENLRHQQILHAQLLQQEQQLLAENEQLRNLLKMQQRLSVPATVGEILYDAHDLFTRKIILNRGSSNGVAPGQPVIDDAGVVGQVTRVYPYASEVTLLTDKEQAIPVQVLRNGLRSVVYGRGQSGILDLRFMSGNADIQKGDVLVTSGIDSVYPAGLDVAIVDQVDKYSNDAFSKIRCLPVAGIDRHKQLLILLVQSNADQKADIGNQTESAAAVKSDKLVGHRLRESAREQEVVKSVSPSKERKGNSTASVPVANTNSQNVAK